MQGDKTRSLSFAAGRHSERIKSIFYKSSSSIPSLTVGVRQVAAFHSVLTNPDREGGDVTEERKTYFSPGQSTS